jgi:hypothetical protein
MKKKYFVLLIMMVSIVGCQKKCSSDNTTNTIVAKSLNIPTVGQKSRTWCWAATAEMMINFHRPDSNKITQIQILEKYYMGQPLDTRKGEPCQFICPSDSTCNFQIFAQYLNCANTLPVDSLEIKEKLFNKLKNEFIYKEYTKLTWDNVVESINDTIPITINLKNGSQGHRDFKDGHYVVISGYLEINGLKFILVKDPWRPCVGCEYLLNFDTCKLGYSLCYSISPTNPDYKFTSTKVLPNSIFDTSIKFVSDFYALGFSKNPLDSSQIINNIPRTLGAIPLVFGIDSTNNLKRKIHKPDALIIYDKNDFKKTAMISKNRDSDWSIDQIQVFPGYPLLCCNNSYKESVCKLSYEVITKSKDSTGKPISEVNTVVALISYPFPDFIIFDEKFETVYKQFEINNQSFIVPVQNIVLDDIKINSTDAIRYDFFKKKYDIAVKQIISKSDSSKKKGDSFPRPYGPPFDFPDSLRP